MDLFDQLPPQMPKARKDAPLAERVRPESLEDVVGQEELLREGGLLRVALERGELPSIVFWGPPGTGKTTLARILAREAGLPFVPFSAVAGGVKEVREIVAEAERRRQRGGKPTLLFVDEIHRFNKAQQDAFLPHVESGTIVLIGATTENPSFELNAALLSRVQVAVLKPLSVEQLAGVLSRALSDEERGLGEKKLTATQEAMRRIARQSHGDVRQALNLLETAATLAQASKGNEINEEVVSRALESRPLRYDKAGEEHYNIASAFIKSMRGSDPDAALYWMARMLEAGEDPKFIARRMVIFASEDVGNADPQALTLAISVARAVEFVGLPEARINLGQGASYLACAPKSNASYAALEAARAEVRQSGPLDVPSHIRNAPTGLMKELGYGKGYEYAHNYDDAASGQTHLPEELLGTEFYKPTEHGAEKEIAARLEALRKKRRGA